MPSSRRKSTEKSANLPAAGLRAHLPRPSRPKRVPAEVETQTGGPGDSAAAALAQQAMRFDRHKDTHAVPRMIANARRASAEPVSADEQCCSRRIPSGAQT